MSMVMSVLILRITNQPFQQIHIAYVGNPTGIPRESGEARLQAVPTPPFTASVNLELAGILAPCSLRAWKGINGM